jgi:hypothetical protein
MMRRTRGLIGCLIGLGLLALSLVCGYRGLEFAATAGDAMFEPDWVCNAACKAEWDRYGHLGDRWMDCALVLCVVAIAVAVWASRKSEVR